ncbi:hypothetical protein A2U01_0064669, partial [Trifolium medium]|nr:hypothetical protein [Trifolium medium]
ILEPARRAGVLARCAVQLTSNGSFHWTMRVAQAEMARRAVEKFQIIMHNGNLRVAQGIWRDAPASVFEEIKALLDGTGVYKRSTGLTHCQHKNWHLTMPRG